MSGRSPWSSYSTFYDEFEINSEFKKSIRGVMGKKN
jgi:hypothetical protein